MIIVISGNPVDGLTHYGPFEDCEEAAQWAENNCSGNYWWVTSLTNPHKANDAD